MMAVCTASRSIAFRVTFGSRPRTRPGRPAHRARRPRPTIPARTGFRRGTTSRSSLPSPAPRSTPMPRTSSLLGDDRPHGYSEGQRRPSRDHGLRRGSGQARPVRVAEPSSWKKASKMRSRLPSGIPGPASRTEMRTKRRSSRRPASRVEMSSTAEISRRRCSPFSRIVGLDHLDLDPAGLRQSHSGPPDPEATSAAPTATRRCPPHS